jgi:hypothetical protein
MSRINPLYVLLFAVLLFIYSAIMLNSVDLTLKDERIKFKNYSKIASRYHHLKDAWKNGDVTKKKIDRILKLYNIKDATINKSYKGLSIKIDNINANISHKFINKILNETIIVYSFKIKKKNLTLKVGL